jgi:cellulose biosynthesis protein BcsQ
MVITIASMKGGVGKTTISAMMARYISDKRSSPVVVIDMDPQRGATITLSERLGLDQHSPPAFELILLPIGLSDHQGYDAPDRCPML